MSAVLVYITCRDLEEARHLGGTLVQERWAACVNMIDGMRSMFWWDDQVQEDEETILLAKTQVGLVTGLTDRVKALHSDTCPCVLALPVIDGNPDFLQWIQAETKT